MFVSGATGALCSVVNGYYEPTEEKGVDGRVMYRKVGDGGVWIEHFEGFYWSIKHSSVEGKVYVSAYTCGWQSLESCASNVWKILDDSVPEISDTGMCINDSRYPADSAVKMLTGPAAQLQVSL